MTQELTELSRLHIAYEDAADPDDGDHPGSSEAAELSGAVGEFLAERGYEARVSQRPVTASLRDRLALLLSDFDANGLQPTNAALDVIMAVIESTELTDGEWSESDGVPTAWRYARDAERFLSQRQSEWAKQ